VPTGCAGKVKEAGERLATGAVPVPVRLTVCVAGLALSVIVNEPLLEPLAVGVKVTPRVQLALAARLAPQLLVWEKSPLVVMLEIVRAALPLFVSVIVSAELVVPTTWLPKSYEDGERATKGTGERPNLVTKAS
jgi:hypothetical protein